MGGSKYHTVIYSAPTMCQLLSSPGYIPGVCGFFVENIKPSKLSDLTLTRITKNYEFKKGVGIDSTIKSTETRILLLQFSLQKFNPYFLAHYVITYFAPKSRD